MTPTARTLAELRKSASERDSMARVIWETCPSPNHPSVTWQNLIPGEYGHAKAYRLADAVLDKAIVVLRWRIAWSFALGFVAGALALLFAAMLMAEAGLLCKALLP